MSKRFIAVVALIFVVSLAAAVVMLSLASVRHTFSPVADESSSLPHVDLGEGIGSEDANVLVMADMPVGQDCVKPTVQALRQLVKMYPEHLFVALLDMETELSAEGPVRGRVTFRGVDVRNRRRVLELIGVSPGARSRKPAKDGDIKTGEDKDSGEKKTRQQLTNLLDVIEEKEKEQEQEAGELGPDAILDGFCALITVNGRSRFSLPTSKSEEDSREVYLSGPYGTLYTAEDVKTVVESEIIRMYGALPEPRTAWKEIPGKVPGTEPQPLFPERRKPLE